MPSTLTVHLHGNPIGVITRLGGDKNIFAFEDDYISDSARPTLSLSFKATSGALFTEVRPTRVRVPTFFSNLLPEGHLRDYLAARAGVKPEREFFLLAALGADLPGAVVISPTGARDHLDDGKQAGVGEAGPLRFSLAGMQLKFSAIMEADGGLTVPASGGGGRWIVKLPSARYPAVPENEFVMMELARRIGVRVPRLLLVSVEEVAGLPADVASVGGTALAAERFDRMTDGTRVHMEDFAQVFGLFPHEKYEKRSYANIAMVLRAEAGQEAVEDFMRRLVFSLLIGNADMHLKNWAVLYPDGRTPVLAPAYDLVATLPYLPNDQLALSFGGTKDIHSVKPDQVRRFADKASLAVNPLWRIVEQTVEQTHDAWRASNEKDLLPNEIRAAINRHLERVARSTLAR